jgi:hypothetical protein
MQDWICQRATLKAPTAGELSGSCILTPFSTPGIPKLEYIFSHAGLDLSESNTDSPYSRRALRKLYFDTLLNSRDS